MPERTKTWSCSPASSSAALGRGYESPSFASTIKVFPPSGFGGGSVIMSNFLHRAFLVHLVCLVCLVYLVEPDRQNKRNKPDRPDEPDRPSGIISTASKQVKFASNRLLKPLF